MPQRTYRLQSGQAPRVLFELSRTGRRLPPVTSSPAAGAAVDVDQQERYEAGGAIASVEHVERLGWFCALRADDPAAIDALALRLGLAPATVEPRSYTELLGPAEAPVAPAPTAPAPAPATLATKARRSRLSLTREDSLLVSGLGALAVAVASGLPEGLIAFAGLLAALRAVRGRPSPAETSSA